MSTAYYVETIERITEQVLVEEILADTEQIRKDGINKVDKIKDEAVNYIAEQQKDLIQQLAETGIRKTLKQIDSDTTNIYNNIQKIVPNTDAKIEDTIRHKIVSNGYSISFNNDGNGNITVNLGRSA